MSFFIQNLIWVMITWFVAGWVIAWALGLPWLRSIQAGLMALIIGLLIVVQVILRNPHLDRLFSYGPEEDEDGNPFLGCFFVIPLMIALIAFLSWLSIQVGRFIGVAP